MHLLTVWFLQIGSYRYRWIFIACLVTLGISVGAVGTILFNRWQADLAVRLDSQSVLGQTSQQMAQLLQNRRRTLALLRDTVDNAPDLDDAERVALAKSAIEQTPGLLGNGLVRKGHAFIWWVPPAPNGSRELSQLNHEIAVHVRSQLFSRSSTRTILLQPDRPLLAMVEPLRARTSRSDRIVAVFDPKVLLSEFFDRTLLKSQAIRVLEGSRILYQSARWRPESQHRPIIERPVKAEGIRWTLQMQSGLVRVVPRSWLNVLVTMVLLLAGLATVGMVWTTERLRELATTDELTGLYNRRFFLERWEGEYERSKRYGRDLSCLMIDVNGFKQVNDLLGHHMGDRVLRQVAQELKMHLRRSDVLARFGGDEFILALPETNLRQAAIVAEKIRRIAIQGPWSRFPRLGPVGLSVGLSQMQSADSPEQVIHRADTSLYASRQAARSEPGRVVQTTNGRG